MGYYIYYVKYAFFFFLMSGKYEKWNIFFFEQCF